MSESHDDPAAHDADDADDLDARYRRAARRDPGGPGASVRDAILEHARGLAVQRSRTARPQTRGRPHDPRRRRRWMAAAGGLAAAVLLGIWVAAPLWEQRPPAAAPTPKSAMDVQPRAAGLTGLRQAPIPGGDRDGQTLGKAARSGDLARLQASLGRVGVDARDPMGRTPLLLAVESDQAAAVDALLAAGADPNAADDRGTRPLQAALALHDDAIVNALRRAGAR